jgi:hypothetical protein
MARSTRKRDNNRNPTGRNGYVLPQEKLEQREKAFALYRDMGPARSLGTLVSRLKSQHPDLAASRPAIEGWSVKHDWATRCKAHDDAFARGGARMVQQNPGLTLDPNFNQVAVGLSSVYFASASYSAPNARYQNYSSQCIEVARAFREHQSLQPHCSPASRLVGQERRHSFGIAWFLRDEARCERGLSKDQKLQPGLSARTGQIVIGTAARVGQLRTEQLLPPGDLAHSHAVLCRWSLCRLSRVTDG